jgi:hypothetical protein
MLHLHRVFTTHQLADLAFDSDARARHRLLVLSDLEVLDRFRPRRETGSAPWHYVLGRLGAAVVAVERGKDPDDPYWRAAKALAVESSQRLDHMIGVNGFFAALVREGRLSGGRSQLVEWQSERRFAARWGEVVRPDGFGRFAEDGSEVSFCLELDNGTESLDRLAGKLPGYADLAVVLGASPWVLFAFPSPRREAEARDALARAPVPVATAVVSPRGSPAGTLWLPAGGSFSRTSLAGLAQVTGCYERSPRG